MFFTSLFQGGPSLTASVNFVWQCLWVIIGYDPNMGESSTSELFHEVMLFQGSHNSHSLQAIVLLNFFSSIAPHYFDWPTNNRGLCLSPKSQQIILLRRYNIPDWYSIAFQFFLENRWMLESILVVCQLSHSNLSCLVSWLSAVSRKSPWDHIAWHNGGTNEFHYSRLWIF